MFIRAQYYYYGSTNCSLHFKKGHKGEIRLLTDYGEQIAAVSNIDELMTVLSDLKAGKYDRDEAIN